MTNALLGARVVNTRAFHQASELDARLRDSGAVPLSYPCIAIVPLDHTNHLDAAMSDLLAGRFDLLLLTSANAVNAIADRLATAPTNPVSPPIVRVAVVGEATATAVADRLNWPVAFVSAERHGEALARELPITAGTRVLMPVSEIASPEPATILRERGASVTSITAYRTITGAGGIDLPALLRQQAVDAITFTSPSTITGCLTRLAAEGGTAADLQQVAIVTIGPTTQEAAKTLGFNSAQMSPTPSMSSLIDTLGRALEQKRAQGGAVWLSRWNA